MPTLNLKNITIKKLQDRNFNDYFLIVNNDNQDEAFFCFKKAVKEGWNNLINNWQNIKEVEKYTEINKVINSAEQRENNSKTYRQVVSFYSPESDITMCA